MIIDKEVLDNLSAQAKASPRLRMNYDLRNSAEDGSQRMLNALEPGTVMPIHRHRTSSETVVIIRGTIQWVFYDDDGNETERVTLDANGELRCLNVEKGRWHSLECMNDRISTRLSNLSDNRMKVAHGMESASTVGAGYTAADLNTFYTEVRDYIAYLISCFES